MGSLLIKAALAVRKSRLRGSKELRLFDFFFKINVSFDQVVDGQIEKDLHLIYTSTPFAALHHRDRSLGGVSGVNGHGFMSGGFKSDA